MFDSTALAPFAVRRCGRFPKRRTLKETQGARDFAVNPEQAQMTNCSTHDLREGAHIFQYFGSRNFNIPSEPISTGTGSDIAPTNRPSDPKFRKLM